MLCTLLFVFELVLLLAIFSSALFTNQYILSNNHNCCRIFIINQVNLSSSDHGIITANHVLHQQLIPSKLLKTLPFLRFFISQQICANKFVRDITFGETPACPILKLILWHFFVKIHIFAHFFEKSPQKSPCLGRLQN